MQSFPGINTSAFFASIYPSIHSSINLSIHPSVRPYIHPSTPFHSYSYLISTPSNVEVFFSSCAVAVDCGPLNAPGNGTIIERVAFTYGHRIVFECKSPGYEMKGSKIRTCQSDGQWSGSLTKCESKYFITIVRLSTTLNRIILDDKFTCFGFRIG